MSIPLVAHFVWFGERLPWIHALAVQSAAMRGGFARLVLHHDADLGRAPHARALAAHPRVELRRLDMDRLLSGCGERAPGLRDACTRLAERATRSDLARLAILYQEGGVYLDMDTITVRPLRDLCQDVDAFCGEERIIYPLRVRGSWNPAVRGLALIRTGLRIALRSVPDGWAAFRRIERFYPRAVNNAIIASAPGSRFISRALDRLVELPPHRQAARCGIGPHLLQEIAPDMAPPQVMVHPPEVFYPLAPEISRHWFRVRRRERGLDVERALSPATRVVHWYGSTRAPLPLSAIDPAYVRAHAFRQLFSALVLPLVDS